MSHQNPYCQMCKKELCVVCKQQLDNCKCPCPNFVICRYCEAHEKTQPPCDDMFPTTCNTGGGGSGVSGGGGGFGGFGGPLSKIMPLFMMMMMNANKQGGGKNCDCSRRSHYRKRERDYSPRRDHEPPSRGCSCCCKTVPPKPTPSCSQPLVIHNICPPNSSPPNPYAPNPVLPPSPPYPYTSSPGPPYSPSAYRPNPYPPNPCPQSCCTCSSRGDALSGKSHEPINQYFFGSDCNPQLTTPSMVFSPHSLKSKNDKWESAPSYQPQKMNQPHVEREYQHEESPGPVVNDARESQRGGSPATGSLAPGSSAGRSPRRKSPGRGSSPGGLLQYGPRKSRNNKNQSITINKK